MRFNFIFFMKMFEFSCSFFMLSFVLAVPTVSADSVEQAFVHIYENGVWGKNEQGEGWSGEGSSLAATKKYRSFLQGFLRKSGIKTVVDVGCGDWEFSKKINWEGIDYTGYDVVESVIRKNQKQFNSDNLHFICGNALTMDLPQADLLICKDVLQHLSNENIMLFLTQISKFKYCLITNDIDPNMIDTLNLEISDGGYRRLDLTQPPFNVQGHKILTYRGASNIKQVLLISSN